MDIPSAVLVIIGRQTVEIAILRGQLSQAQQAAQDLTCPDTSKHQEDAHGGDVGG